MANGQFLQDLSSGIFGRLGELQTKQNEKDEQRRGEVLSLLAGLADKVEPESLPTLMGHIGDVMKLKGPMKKFWNAFSGMPDRGFEDQIGTKLSETLGSAVGPDTAMNLRESNKQNLLKPFRAEGTRPRSVEALNYRQAPELEGKMVLRDPRREELSKIAARYEGQEQLMQDRLALSNEFKSRENELKRAHDTEMLNQRFELKRGQAQSELAGWLQTTFPDKYDYNSAYQEAGRRLLNKKEADLDQVLQKIELMKSTGRLQDTQANQLEEGTKPSDVMAERRFDKDQQKEFRTLQSELATSQARSRSIDPQIKNLESKLQGLADRAAPGKGKFIPGVGFQGVDPFIETLPMVKPVLDEYNNLLKEKESVLTSRKTKYGQLTTQFRDYIEPSLSEEDEIKLRQEFGGVSPAGAPRTTPKKAIPPTLPGKGGDGGQSSRYFRSPNPEKYSVGQKFKDANGRLITVIGIGPTGEIYYK